jgi:hypothetical protein
MGLAKELVASIDSYGYSRRASVRFRNKEAINDRNEISAHGSRVISGLSYKTAFSNELLTSILPL